MIFCDECKNFPPTSSLWGVDLSKKGALDKCTLNIPMRFKMPCSPTDDEWGFYKKDCRRFEPTSKQSGDS